MSRFFRPLKEGFQGVSRNFAMAVSSVSSVTVTLLIMAFFILLSVNIETITFRLEESVQIHVILEKDVSEQEREPLQAEIAAFMGVDEVVFSDKDNEFEVWIANFDDPKAEEMYGDFRGENNPMHDAFIITTKTGADITQIAELTAGLEGIESVNYGGDVSTTFIDSLETVRNFGFILVAALGVIAVFLISNTIRVSIASRGREISIMRTVGATNWFIRWPFIVEGMIIGFIGSIIPILVTVFGYRHLYNETGGFIFTKLFSLAPTTPLVFETSMIIALIGIGVGALGSIFSVGKQLRWTR